MKVQRLLHLAILALATSAAPTARTVHLERDDLAVTHDARKAHDIHNAHDSYNTHDIYHTYNIAHDTHDSYEKHTPHDTHDPHNTHDTHASHDTRDTREIDAAHDTHEVQDLGNHISAESHLPHQVNRHPETPLQEDLRNTTVNVRERGITKAYNNKANASNASKKPSKAKVTEVKNLLRQLKKFTMVTSVEMKKPPATGTTSLSSKAMVRSGVPMTLKAKLDRFNAAAVLEKFERRFDVPPHVYRKTVAFLAGSVCTAECDKPVSGEADLSGLMFRQLGALDVVIRAIKAGRTWSIAGKGRAPVEDWTYSSPDGEPAAVLEIKTTDSMPNAVVQEILGHIEAGDVVMRRVPDKENEVSNTLIMQGDQSQTREGRGKASRIVEQVIAEMYATGSNIGALTNLEDWIVFERNGTRVEATYQSGKTNDGKSNALNIMLAVSLSVPSPNSQPSTAV